jgi:inositol phosphorylceramide mannosyltransferase catalytic subunit
MSYRIPKRIIQTGRQPEQPLPIRAFMANVRLLNPDYEYLFFDDGRVEEFIAKEFPQYRPVFESFQVPIQRYDFFRYLAVYHYGGFYLDLDVLLGSGLSTLLERGCVFPFERLTFSHRLRTELRMDWEIGNYAFGAAAGHPFLEAIIKNCVRAQSDPLWVKSMIRGTPPLDRDLYSIFYSTGPGLCSRTLAENPELARTVTVLVPDDVCDVRNWYHFGEYGVHLMNSSWRPERGFVTGRLGYYHWRWMERRLLKKSRASGRSHGSLSWQQASTRTLPGEKT